MAFEKVEPHGRLTIAGFEFAWDMYQRAKAGFANPRNQGNMAMSPMLIQYQLVLMAHMSTGQTRDRLLQCMHLDGNESLEEIMFWTLWRQDYFVRELGVSYGTKPIAALVIARNRNPVYTENILPWVNHYRLRKSFHIVRQLKEAEKQVNAIVRRLTGAYPRDPMMEMYPPQTFDDNTRAIVAIQIYLQVFMPSAGTVLEVNTRKLPFWRRPLFNKEHPQAESFLDVRTVKVLKKMEYLEDEWCQLFGLDIYPGNLTTYYLLPKMTQKDGNVLNVNDALSYLEERLDGMRLHQYIEHLLAQNTDKRYEILVTMPFFYIETIADLDRPLYDMGLSCLFKPTNDDWTNLFKDSGPGGRDFYLSAIRQNIIVQFFPSSTVNSGRLVEEKNLRKHIPSNWSGREVRLDRPFLFFIYDRFTRAILMIGRCQQPYEGRQW